MARRLITERELILPALHVINTRPGILNSQLIKILIELVEPVGRDDETLANRNATYFSQKVRNLKSHDTLEKEGLATYTPIGKDGIFTITEKGRQLLRQNNIKTDDDVKYLFS